MVINYSILCFSKLKTEDKMKFETLTLIMLAVFVAGAILYVIAVVKERKEIDKENNGLFNSPKFFDE